MSDKSVLREGELTARVMRELTTLGAKVWVLSGNIYQTEGVPDRYIIHPLYTGFIEFKNIRTPVKAIQRIRCRESKSPIARFDGTIENFSGKIIANWDLSGNDLLNQLYKLRKDDAL